MTCVACIVCPFVVDDSSFIGFTVASDVSEALGVVIAVPLPAPFALFPGSIVVAEELGVPADDCCSAVGEFEVYK